MAGVTKKPQGREPETVSLTMETTLKTWEVSSDGDVNIWAEAWEQIRDYSDGPESATFRVPLGNGETLTVQVERGQP